MSSVCTSGSGILLGKGLSRPTAVWSITNLQKFHTNCSIYLTDFYTLLCNYDVRGWNTKQWWWGEHNMKMPVFWSPAAANWQVENAEVWNWSTEVRRKAAYLCLVPYWLCVFWDLVAKPKGDSLPAMWELDLGVSDRSKCRYHDATVSGQTLPKTNLEWPGKPCRPYVPDALKTVIQMRVTHWKSSSVVQPVTEKSSK